MICKGGKKHKLTKKELSCCDWNWLLQRLVQDYHYCKKVNNKPHSMIRMFCFFLKKNFSKKKTKYPILSLKNKEDFLYRGNGHLPCKRSSWAYFWRISLQRVNIEPNARRVITILSFDDDGSLINEYFNKVSKQIFENSSRNRRAESISNHRNVNSVRMND